MKINETIELTENEELEIDISKIQYLPNCTRNISWMRLTLKSQDIVSAGATLTENGDWSIDENTLELYIKNQLSKTLGIVVTGFRWTWDKYRYFNA